MHRFITELNVDILATRFCGEMEVRTPPGVVTYVKRVRTIIYNKKCKPFGDEILWRNFRSSTRSNRKLLREGENGNLYQNI